MKKDNHLYKLTEADKDRLINEVFAPCKLIQEPDILFPVFTFEKARRISNFIKEKKVNGKPLISFKVVASSECLNVWDENTGLGRRVIIQVEKNAPDLPSRQESERKKREAKKRRTSRSKPKNKRLGPGDSGKQR